MFLNVSSILPESEPLDPLFREGIDAGQAVKEASLSRIRHLQTSLFPECKIK